MRAHILAVGEALIDVVHSADGTVTEHAGGSVANVAVAIARLGQPVRLATWIGRDGPGARVVDWLEASGVALTPGSDGAPRTPTATATIAGDGTATYDFDLTWRLPTGTTIEPDTVVVHTGSIASVLEPAVSELVAAARPAATISYDPNVRPAVIGARDDVLPIVERFVALADIVRVSDEDLAWLHPDEPPDAVAQRWLALGPAIVVLTLGAAGSRAWAAAGEHRQPPPSEPLDVVDTVGAGDALTGALLWSLGQGGLLGAANRRRLERIDVGQLGRHVAVASRAAELTVQRAGADPPTRAELEAR